jgi:hypothetical protein
MFNVDNYIGGYGDDGAADIDMADAKYHNNRVDYILNDHARNQIITNK